MRPCSRRLDTARTVLRWYELRCRIERFFHALKVGTRIEDHHLDEADDLRKCLAFDAITAFRVWDLSLLAREKPDDPARRHVTREDVTALCALAAHHGFKAPRGPPDMTIARFVMLTAGLAGFHPSKGQCCPEHRSSGRVSSSCPTPSSPYRPCRKGTGIGTAAKWKENSRSQV